MKIPTQLKSRPAQICMAIISLGLAYVMVSLAIDTGSWWQYLATVILLVCGLKQIIHTIKSK